MGEVCSAEERSEGAIFFGLYPPLPTPWEGVCNHPLFSLSSPLLSDPLLFSPPLSPPFAVYTPHHSSYVAYLPTYPPPHKC